jgi:hypothetical protein
VRLAGRLPSTSRGEGKITAAAQTVAHPAAKPASAHDQAAASRALRVFKTGEVV